MRKDKKRIAEIELDEDLNKMDIEDLEEIIKRLKSFDYDRELMERKKEIEEERRKKWNCILELKEKLRRMRGAGFEPADPFGTGS